MNLLHLGRPEFCQGSLPSNFSFDDNSSPRINIVLCGTPQPKLEAEFIGQKLNILNITIDSYTRNYTMQLPRLTQIACGKELTVRAIGNDGVITDETKMKRYSDVSLQLLCMFESLSPNKTTLKELKQRGFVSFKLFCVFITMF